MQDAPRDLNKINLALVTLATCCVGAISPNFRRILMNIEGPPCNIVFCLKERVAEDLEEIESVLTVFEGAIYSDRFTHEIRMTSEWPLSFQRPFVAVFGMREDVDINL